MSAVAEKLTRKQMRLAVAKDVLKRLDERKIRPGFGYLSPQRNIRPIKLGESLQPHVDRLGRACEVCAIGAACLSYIGLFNEAVCDDPPEDDDHYWAPSWDRGKIAEICHKAFSPKQLQLMEAAYEGYGHSRDEISYAARQRAIRFCWRIDPFNHDGKARMRAIFENIIKNDGDFKP